MSECTCHSAINVNVRTYDPTRTTGLRNAFVADLNKRFNELKRVIRIAIVDQDVFGLQPQTFALTPPAQKAFAFGRSKDKVEAFMRWLQSQVDKGILEVGTFTQVGSGVEQAWTNKYITDSYKRGVIRARYELDTAGFSVPSIAQTGGVEISMATPFHVDRLGLLYSRTFTELKGITGAMDLQISRVLTQGIADGDGPRLLARKLIAAIDGKKAGDLGVTDTLGRYIPAQRRAEIMARTEVIRAHHQATVTEYKNWAVQGVVVKAEWSTAGDNRVCSQCQALEAEVFSLDIIMNMIPLHPQCRCIALPFRVGVDTPITVNSAAEMNMVLNKAA